MRLIYCVLPAVGLLAGCAQRMPATEARVVRVAYMPAAEAGAGVHGYMPPARLGYMPPARRAVEDVGHASRPVPNIDLNKVCRVGEPADNPDADRRQWCLKDERDAKIELQRRWSTSSPAERSACVPSSSGGVEPSYVELLTCFEMGAFLKEGPSAFGRRTQR